MNKNTLPFIVSLIFAFGIFLGFQLQEHRSGQKNIAIHNAGNGSKIQEVLNYIDARYVEDVDTEELYEKGIDEILSELDPHSTYISREEITDVNEEMAGNFEGIGIEFFIVKDTITVVSSINGGPSEKLGILSGDKIVQVNDSIVAGKGIKNSGVVKLLKGPRGSKVKVSVKRFGEDELIDFNITRDRIPIVSVDAGFMLDDITAYIKISRFSASTYKEFAHHLYELKQENRIKNLIIDLRDNHGGYLSEATDILDEIIDGRKELVYTEGKHNPRQFYRAKKPGLFEDGRVLVLINENSASASEIVAGAIQDWDRGLIVGRRSFGKGLVQEQYKLSDGSALRLTVSKYYTPSGRCIQVPYKGELEDYYNRINKRLEAGELYSQDSIIHNDSLTYFTKIKQRKVFGGGGIMPDIFVPLDTTFTNDLLIKIVRRAMIQEFSYNLHEGENSLFGDHEDYKNFISDKRIDEQLFDRFVTYLNHKDIDTPKDQLGVIREDLIVRLKAHIIKLKWGNEAYYEMLMTDDDFIRAALGEITTSGFAEQL